MAWQTFSLHFKQQYDGGFRYLDRCGELMLAAMDKMNFLPAETKPSGAKLEIPECGLVAFVDTLELVVGQEMADIADEFFLRTCAGLTELVNEHIQPKRITRNGFASKSYWAISNADSLFANSLKFGGNAHAELGKQLGMVPAHKLLDFNFTSGSMDLHVKLHPVTFEKVSVNRHNPQFKATSSQKERVERLNKFADNFNVHLSNALMLEIDLMEVDPPQRSLAQHFNELKRYTDILRKQFTAQ